MTALENRLDKIRQLPLHRFMGLETLTAADGSAQLQVTVEDNAINPAGMLHGGVVYTLSDVCAYAAVLSLLPAEQEAVTHDLHIAVLRPGQRHDRLQFSAKVIKRGRQLAFVNVEATIDDKLIALVRVTKSIIG